LNTVLLLPFAYFYKTRLSKGALAFHALFEWLAAAWLVTCVGASTIGQDLLTMALVYLAFISLYELGYMANDLHAARHESDGRRRGPQGAATQWVAAWVLVRIAAFLGVTAVLDQWSQLGWWFFFAALLAVFALHNWLEDREMKTSTFAWLAWFRFMAPVMFVVQDSQRMGIGLAAAIGYVAFRQLGYLDSKGLLKMPGRQRHAFRRFFFLMPLFGIGVLWPYPEAQGYAWLTAYWAVVAVMGTLLAPKSNPKQGEGR
jgi:hypothetical protein